MPAEPGTWPDLTVVVPAYREAGVIAAKVDDLRANGYPGHLQVLVVADGDPETAAAAERAGAGALTGPERIGKSQALNRGFEETDTPIVVISDANNRLVPGALAAAVEHFADPDVGAVAGEKIEDDGGGGESLYWKFESWLKQREDRLGTTIGLVGELAAIRSAAWRPFPPTWPATTCGPRSTSTSRVSGGLRAESPCTRSAVGSLSAQWEAPDPHGVRSPTWRRAARRQLLPSAGLVAAELWGHRLVRYTVSPLGPPRPGGARSVEGALERGWPGSFCWPICVRAPDWRPEARRGRPRKRPGGGSRRVAAPWPPQRRPQGTPSSCRGWRSEVWCGDPRGDRQTKWSTVER